MNDVVKDLEKLVLNAIDFNKIKAGILAGDKVEKIIAESIDLAGLAIGLLEGVAEPLLAELSAKNAIVAGLEPILVAAMNPVAEHFLNEKVAELKAKFLA